MSRFAVIGVGNPLRGDDGAGIAVARALRRRAPGGRVWECGGEPADLLELFAAADDIVVVDAVAGAGSPGAIRWLAADSDFADVRATSSHGLGLAASISLARALGALPARLSILGIEGARFGVGEPMTADVERAVSRAVGLLVRRLRGGTNPEPSRRPPARS